MTIYRTLPSSPEEIALTVQRTTFLGRLGLALRQKKGTLALFALGPMAIPFGLALLELANDEPGYAYGLLKWGAIVGETIFFLPVLLVLAWRAGSARDSDTLLPQKLVLREASIEVTSRGGETTVERWTWIPIARETMFGFVLVLSENPYTEIAVPGSSLSEKQRSNLRVWLRENGCIPRKAAETRP